MALSTSKVQSNNSVEMYNTTNSPLSVDYAALLAWIMDKWFLYDIPINNLIPDPAFIPKESIRTFYVDQNWFKVFVDGALSICHHFNDNDDVREAIKATLSTYLSTNLPNGSPPQVPRWGFLLRSDIISKFPDLCVNAPWPNPTDLRPQVIRAEQLDQDLLIVLFDREPGVGNFPQGIQIHPPQHQLSFSLDGINTPSVGHWHIAWKKVKKDFSGAIWTQSNTQPTLDAVLTDTPSSLFWPTARVLNPAPFALAAVTGAQEWFNPYFDMPGPTPALVGAQLVTGVPVLTLVEPTIVQVPGARAVSATVTVDPFLSVPAPSLSTSRPRPARRKQRAIANPPYVFHPSFLYCEPY